MKWIATGQLKQRGALLIVVFLKDHSTYGVETLGRQSQNQGDYLETYCNKPGEGVVVNNL